MHDAVEALRKAAEKGDGAVMARVVEIEGFSTRPGDDLVAVDSTGTVHGSLLAGLASRQLQDAARSLLESGTRQSSRVIVDVHDREAVAAGLACGGRAHLLLQPSAVIPPELWRLLGARAPAAMLTKVDGGEVLVVDGVGSVYGEGGGDWPVGEAVSMLRARRSGSDRVETAGRSVLIESWVPDPRLVVVGTGELIDAISTQASLLGWETRTTGGGDELVGLLEWAGVTGALIVLSHDPHVDTPALAAGLREGIGYVGALGSRATQSRRTERLLAQGIQQVEIDRMHRPIGLDLGGRRAPEVALAIVAEILAGHCGRDAQPLSARSGPIH